MNRWPTGIRASAPGIVVLLIGLSLPFWFITSKYSLVIVMTVMIWAIAAQGWNIVGGYGGLLSFGHSVFFGIGAYTTAILTARLGISPWIGMAAGAVLSAIIGAVLTFPALRLKGTYFTLASFVLALLLTDIAVIAVPVTGGDLGINLPFLSGNDFWMLQFDDRLNYYYILVIFLAVATLVVGLVAYSKLGLFLRSSRDDPDAARTAGVDVTRVRLVGLMISAAITSIAGSLMLQFLGAVTPGTSFSATAAFTIGMAALVGGRGTIVGPILGAAILIPAQQVLASVFSDGPAGISGIAYAVVIIAVVMFDSRGIVHVLQRIGRAVLRIVRRRPVSTVEGIGS